MKILIIDDSEMMAKVLYKIISLAGFEEIVIANNGVDALKLLESGGSEFGLILSDYIMPGMNGLELLEKVRENGITKDTPFILLTGHMDGDVAREAVKLRANDLVAKPFVNDVVITKIKKHIKKS